MKLAKVQEIRLSRNDDDTFKVCLNSDHNMVETEYQSADIGFVLMILDAARSSLRQEEKS